MINQLLAFLDVNADTKASGTILADLLAPRLDAIIESFYDHLRAYNISPHITAEIVPKLKDKQKQHWLALFKSGFGADYCASARRIAIRHRDIDLNPLWYIAGYTHLKFAYVEAILDSDFEPLTKKNLVKALEKYIAIDMALALSTYEAIVLA